MEFTAQEDISAGDIISTDDNVSCRRSIPEDKFLNEIKGFAANSAKKGEKVKITNRLTF